MDHHRQEQPHRVPDDVSLPSGSPLASVVPPFRLPRQYETVWVSTIAAEGLFLRPSACLRRARNTLRIFSQVPSSRQRR